MGKHTPGPWEWDDEGTQPENEYYGIIPEVMMYAGCGSHRVSVPNPADARLIAAAPELLEALEGFLRAVRYVPMRAADCDQDEVEKYEKMAWAAIAKAKGE